ncbi:MAG TPA: dienelactone hydrolase family protein [Candidatus Eisenbacteria bacterium]
MSRSRLLLAATLTAIVALLASRTIPGLSAASAPKSTAPETTFVQLGSGDAAESAFVATPPGDKPLPGIVVVHEWWGLNGQIRDVGRRLANQGYLAIVPDLYHGKVADDPMKAHELTRGLVDKEAIATLEQAVAWLRAQPRVAKSRVGVIGFCMGGGLALQVGLEDPGLSAVVMFYGAPETDPERLAQLKGALQGHFGEQDQGIPPKRVEEFRDALKKIGKTAEIYEYPGAGHAFMHDGAESYRPDAARQAWARTLAFFQKYLRG